MDEKTTSAGIDWAKDEHALCVIDQSTGRVLFERRFAHEEGGIAKLCGSLVEMGVWRVAIERPEGILVERVLEAGIVVLPIHPNQLKAARPPLSGLRILRQVRRLRRVLPGGASPNRSPPLSGTRARFG